MAETDKRPAELTLHDIKQMKINAKNAKQTTISVGASGTLAVVVETIIDLRQGDNPQPLISAALIMLAVVVVLTALLYLRYRRKKRKWKNAFIDYIRLGGQSCIPEFDTEHTIDERIAAAWRWDDYYET